MRRLLLIFLLITILTSCISHNQIDDTLNGSNISLDVSSSSLALFSSVLKVIDFSPYHKSSILLHPVIYTGDNNLYVIHRYPEILLSNTDMVVEEIEDQYSINEVIVYEYAGDWFNEIKRISLHDIEERRINIELLYVDEYSGNINLVGWDNNSKTIKCFFFDSEGNYVDENELPDTLHPHMSSYILKDQYLYYNIPTGHHVDHFSTLYYKVYRYNIETGKSEILLDGVSAFSFYGDKIAYLKMDGSENNRRITTKEFEKYKDELYKLLKRNLYIYDLENDTHSYIAPFNSNMAVYKMRIDEDGKYIIFADYNNVFHYSFETQITTKIIESSEPIVLGDIFGNTFNVLIGGTQMTLYKLDDHPVSVANSRISLNLTKYMSIPSSAVPYENIFRIVQQNGYNVTGEWGYTSADLAEYTNTMAKKLMAGDTDFDIFYVSTEMAGMFDAAYYEDLSKYSLLNGYYDRMQPGAKGICSIDGTPCLVPVDLYTFMNRADTSYLTGEYDLPQTLEDLVQFKAQVTLQSGSYLLSGNRAFVLFQPLFEQFAANFMNRTVSDREAKRDLTFLYETVYDLMQDDTVYLGDGGTRKKHVFDFVQNRGSFSLKENQHAIPVLKVSEDYGETWHGGFWAVNPNSENKMLAVIFLACMIEDELAHDRELSQLYQGERTDDSEVYDLYLDQLASGVRGYQIPDFKSYLRDQFEELESGESTPAEAADVLWRYLKMVRDE